MRKLIFLLMAVTLPLFVSEMGAEEIEVKEIPLRRKSISVLNAQALLCRLNPVIMVSFHLSSPLSLKMSERLRLKSLISPPEKSFLIA